MNTTTAARFGNRHGQRSYPAGTAVEVLVQREDFTLVRVVGTRSIKGYVRTGSLINA